MGQLEGGKFAIISFMLLINYVIMSALCHLFSQSCLDQMDHAISSTGKEHVFQPFKPLSYDYIQD